MKNNASGQTLKREKASIAVLVFAAVFFFGALFWIYSGDVISGAEDIFDVYGDEQVDFEKATVVKVLNEEMKIDEAADDAYSGNQELEAVVKSGKYKGETMVVYNYFGPLRRINRRPDAQSIGII